MPEAAPPDARRDSQSLASAEPEMLIVLVPEREQRRKRKRAPRPEPTATLTVSLPRSLAEELKDTVSVLPGVSLDSLVAEALERIVAGYVTAIGSRPRSVVAPMAPGIADEYIVVITDSETA